MAVIVQTLVRADASGVLFTADPATAQRPDHREAGFDSGALVSAVSRQVPHENAISISCQDHQQRG
jgi:phosphoenolpyruvate synthase/pyruvate phosphate dikinase